jgi:hypothetical protein
MKAKSIGVIVVAASICCFTATCQGSEKPKAKAPAVTAKSSAQLWNELDYWNKMLELNTFRRQNLIRQVNEARKAYEASLAKPAPAPAPAPAPKKGGK